jgi:hypothetical protein
MLGGVPMTNDSALAFTFLPGNLIFVAEALR